MRGAWWLQEAEWAEDQALPLGVVPLLPEQQQEQVSARCPQLYWLRGTPRPHLSLSLHAG